MSIEGFFHSLPVGEVADTIERKRGVNTQKPLLIVFAEEMVRDGSSALRIADDEADESGESNAELFERTKAEHCKIFFGTLMIGLIEMREDGHFDLDRFAGRLNEAFTGTRFGQISASGKRTLDDEGKETIDTFLERDPTYSFFFLYPDTLLPEPVYNVFVGLNFFDYVKENKVLEEWWSRASALFEADKKEPTKAEREIGELLDGIESWID